MVYGPKQNIVQVELKAVGNLPKELQDVNQVIRRATDYAHSLDSALRRVSVTAKGIQISGFRNINGARVGFTDSLPLDPLKNKIDEVTNAARGGIFGPAFWANFASQGAFAVLGQLQNALAGLTGKLMEAAKMQTQFIASASDLGSGLKIGMPESIKLQEQTQIEVSRIAAQLPGDNKNYLALFQGITPSISSINQGNPERFREQALDITKRAGVLSAIRNIDPGFSGIALNRFIAGNMGFNESMQADIFQKNSVFQQALRDILDNLGVSTKDWKKLTTQQRYAITQAALKVATPDSLVREFQGTAEEVIQRINTDLFDPLIGAFGFMRRVGEMGNRRVVDAFTQFLQNWEALGRQFLEKTGLKFDPMAWLIKGLDKLADIASGFSVFLDKVKLPKNFMDFSGFMGASGVEMGAIVTRLNSWLVKMFEDIPWYEATQSITRFLVSTGLTIDWPRVVWDGFVLALRVVLEVTVGLIEGLVLGLADAVHAWWRGIVKMWDDNTKGFTKAFTDFFEKALRWVTTLGGLIPNSTPTVAQPVQGIGSPQPSGDTKPAETTQTSSGTNPVLDLGRSVLEGMGIQPSGEQGTPLPGQPQGLAVPGQPQDDRQALAVPLAVPGPTDNRVSVIRNNLNAPVTINGSNSSPDELAAAFSSQITGMWSQLNRETLSAAPA